MNGIIGPYLFGDDDGKTVTVNADQYAEMLQNLVQPSLARKRILSKTMKPLPTPALRRFLFWRCLTPESFRRMSFFFGLQDRRTSKRTIFSLYGGGGVEPQTKRSTLLFKTIDSR